MCFYSLRYRYIKISLNVLERMSNWYVTLTYDLDIVPVTPAVAIYRDIVLCVVCAACGPTTLMVAIADINNLRTVLKIDQLQPRVVGQTKFFYGRVRMFHSFFLSITRAIKSTCYTDDWRSESQVVSVTDINLKESTQHFWLDARRVPQKPNT